MKEAAAQKVDDSGSLGVATAAERKGSWVALPVIYYKPEARVGFGALGMRLFSLDAADTSVLTSNVPLFCLYTIHKQILILPGDTPFRP